jgi:hypothetical protein
MMDQLSFFEQPEPVEVEQAAPGLRRYAVIRKTFPPRRTPRPTYLFLLLIETWAKKKETLERMARNGGPTYELVTLIDHSIKRTAAQRIREMYPNAIVHEDEVI